MGARFQCPLIAIYALLHSSVNSPFGGLTRLLRDWILIGQEMGCLLYVITPGSLDVRRRRVRAWLYEGDKGWRQAWRPWPDFIIQRIIRRPSSQRSLILWEERQLLASGCSFLNRSLGSKWEVHNLLVRDPTVGKHLPCTRPLHSLADLQEMVRDYGSIYLKPSWGTQGRHIWRVQRGGQGWIIAYHHGGRPRILRIPSFRCQSWLEQTVKKRSYLVQQAIHGLQTAQEEPIDFRWLLQKDGKGQWQVTARVARIGQPQAIACNVHAGGKVKRAEEILSHETEVGENTLLELDQLSYKVARLLEKKYGKMGEIGLDWLVEKTGTLWFLEANPRPGRKMLRLLDDGLRALSLRRPLEYAVYTSG